MPVLPSSTSLASQRSSSKIMDEPAIIVDASVCKSYPSLHRLLSPIGGHRLLRVRRRRCMERIVFIRTGRRRRSVVVVVVRATHRLTFSCPAHLFCSMCPWQEFHPCTDEFRFSYFHQKLEIKSIPVVHYSLVILRCVNCKYFSTLIQ